MSELEINIKSHCSVCLSLPQSHSVQMSVTLQLSPDIRY